MSNALIALFAAIGGSTWIYTKFNRSTGGNTQSSIIATAISGLVIFLFMLFILGLVIPK